MAKINNTTTFPIVPAADVSDEDLLIGTDVSDTTNDDAGETKNFRVGDLRGGMVLITSASVSGSTSAVDITSFIDTSLYNDYILYFDNLTVSGTSSYNISLSGSNDGFSTTEFVVSICVLLRGSGNGSLAETGFGFVELGNIGISSFYSKGRSARYVTSTGSTVSGSDYDIVEVPSGGAADALRIAHNTGVENIESINYYLYGLRNT